MADNNTKIVITAMTDQAESAMRSLGGSVRGLSSGLNGLAGALSVGAFAAFVKGSIDAADGLGKLAQKTGSSVETLAGLKFAADQNATSLESVAAANKKLSVTMTENPELFKKMGVSATDSTEAMVQIADIFQSMPDGVEKSALAQKLFGKAGEEMIPILNNGTAALRAQIEEGQRLYPVTTQIAEESARLNDQIDRMATQFQGIGITIGGAVVPVINSFMGGIKLAAVEIAHLLEVGSLAFEYLFSPSKWGEGEQFDKRLKELSRIAEEQKIAIVRDMEGMDASPKSNAPATAGREFLGGFKPQREDKAAKESKARDDAKRIQDEIDKQQEKYDKIEQMAILASANDADRISWKLAFDLEAMEKEKAAKIERNAWNDQLEESYQQARITREQMAADEVKRIRDKEMRDKHAADGYEIQAVRSLFAFKQSMRVADLSNSLSMLEKATAGMAHHSRAAFEINKAASIANIMVKAPSIITNAYDSGMQEWGSYWGGVAYAAAATIAIGAQLSAAQSATFGGGGGSIPASGGTVGMPASDAVAQSGTQPALQQPVGTIQQAPREININLRGNDMYSAQQIRDYLIPAINEATGDGVNLNVSVSR